MRRARVDRYCRTGGESRDDDTDNGFPHGTSGGSNSRKQIDTRGHGPSHSSSRQTYDYEHRHKNYGEDYGARPSSGSRQGGYSPLAPPNQYSSSASSFAQPPPFRPSKPPVFSGPVPPGSRYRMPPPPLRPEKGSVPVYAESHSASLQTGQGMLPPPPLSPLPTDTGLTKGPASNTGIASGPTPNIGIPRGHTANTSFTSGPPPNINFASGPPPNTSFASGPPPNTNYASGPPPNTSFASGPPPNTSFASGPPPNTSFASGPPPNTSFARGPPPNTDFARGPPPKTNFASGPPPNTNFARGPPPNTNFASVLPPNTSFARGPPPNTDFARGPTPKNDSASVPPPNTDFARGPPPNTDFARGPPPNTDFATGPPPPNSDFLRGPPPNTDFASAPQPNRGPLSNTGIPSRPPLQNNLRIGGDVSYGGEAAHSAYGLALSSSQNAFLNPSQPGPVPAARSERSGQAFYSGGQSVPSGSPLMSASSVRPRGLGDSSGKSQGQREVDMWLKRKGIGSSEFKPPGVSRTESTTGPTAPVTPTASNKAKPAGSISLGEGQSRLCRMLHSLATIQGELQQLQATADTETWEASVARLGQLKMAYLKTKQKVDPAQLKSLKIKLDLRKKKRARQKRRRQEEREAEQQELFERTQKHAAIDQRLAKLRQDYLNQQQLKKMKETADRTLGKVRRELKEARKMQDTVRGLQKLRDIRNDTAHKRGQTFAPSVAEHFSENTDNLLKLLSEQIKAHEGEEDTLKLLLESENEQAKEKEREKKRQKEREEQRMEMEEESLSLFGLQDVKDAGQVMEPFTQFYTQAQHNLQALLSIRQAWDCFLVEESCPLASRVPDGWVSAEPPSSAVWASVLTQPPS